jgi:hypothetical protein
MFLRWEESNPNFADVAWEHAPLTVQLDLQMASISKIRTDSIWIGFVDA